MQAPSSKVAVGAVIGACVAIMLWIVKVGAHVDVPGEIGAAMTTVATFVTSYLTPDPND